MYGRKINMDSEELLLEQARLYIRLSGDPGSDPEQVEKEFIRLKDMIIVEVYFMKAIRSIITREEMSGFILFVEKDLRTMMETFDPERGRILPFLRHNMELRALTYLALTRRSRCLNSGMSLRRITDGDNMDQPGPEDILLAEEQPEKEPGTAACRLRSICAFRPSRRRNLFIFLCTLLPSLTAATVDNFCRILNIDRAQTGVIADYLTGMAETVSEGRKSRAYMRLRRNFYNMRRIELESHLRTALDTDPLERELSYQKNQLKRVHNRIVRMRMNVRYNILADLLGIAPHAVATAVYYAKNVFELVSMDNVESYCGPMRKALQVSERRTFEIPPVFEPFSEFGITMLPEPPSEAELFLSDGRLAPPNGLSSKHGTRQKNPSCKLECAQAS